VKTPCDGNEENDFLGPIKIDRASDVRVANRDPEKYPFYRVLGATRFYTAKSRTGNTRVARNLGLKLGSGFA
jgi:hypothetical protein